MVDISNNLDIGVIGVVSNSNPERISALGNPGNESFNETDPIEEEYGKVVRGIGTEEIWKAVRKVSNPNVRNVTRVLYLQGMTFGELRIKTGLSDNDLNHVLYDMKKLGLIVVVGDKKGKAKYHLTQYYVALLDALRVLKDRLGKLEDLQSAAR